MDNLITGARDNVAAFASHPSFTFIERDVCEPLEIGGVIDDVFNLASLASPVAYSRYPLETLRVGTVGTANLLELAALKDARFLFASTSEIYGNPLVHPQTEDYWGNVNPIGPRSCYDESKRCGEAFVMAYRRSRSVDTRIVRIFNTYGPRMSVGDGRVVPAFISSALRDAPITVFGDGLQTRSLCYIDDLIRGLLAAVERGNDLPYNLGSPEEITVRALAELVIAEAGSRSSTIFGARPVDDPDRRRPNIDRARNELGWEPQVALRDGIATTLEHFRRLR